MTYEQKIEYFKNHKNYYWLKKKSDRMILLNQTVGLNQIIAEDFIARINKASIEILQDWLDGKNNLEWALLEVRD